MHAAGNECELIGYPEQEHAFFHRKGMYAQTVLAMDVSDICGCIAFPNICARFRGALNTFCAHVSNRARQEFLVAHGYLKQESPSILAELVEQAEEH